MDTKRKWKSEAVTLQEYHEELREEALRKAELEALEQRVNYSVFECLEKRSSFI